jgi:hypothetical protein
MIKAAGSELLHDVPADLSGLTDLERRTLTCRAELATLFRGVQGVAALAACNVEAGGSMVDFGSLLNALGQLNQRLGDETERYGALLSSAGSA